MMMTIQQKRSRVRSQLFRFSMDMIQNLGASPEDQSKAMPRVLTKSFELEEKMSDEEVIQVLKEGPAATLLRAHKLI